MLLPVRLLIHCIILHKLNLGRIREGVMDGFVNYVAFAELGCVLVEEFQLIADLAAPLRHCYHIRGPFPLRPSGCSGCSFLILPYNISAAVS